MLKAANQRIKYCYEQALLAEERAAQEQDDSERRRFWLDNQARWLALVASIEYEARLLDFLKELRRYIKSPFCSACGFTMRPKRLVASSNGLFEFQYECANCGVQKAVSELAAGASRLV